MLLLADCCCNRVSFSASVSALQFVLASYDINGTWLGLHNWTLQLQACGGHAREAALWTRCGVWWSSATRRQSYNSAAVSLQHCVNVANKLTAAAAAGRAHDGSSAPRRLRPYSSQSLT